MKPTPPPTNLIKSILRERGLRQSDLGRAVQLLIPNESLASVHAQVSRCLGPASPRISRWWWLIFHALQIPYPNNAWGDDQAALHPLQAAPNQDPITTRIRNIESRLKAIQQDLQQVIADHERSKKQEARSA